MRVKARRMAVKMSRMACRSFGIRLRASKIRVRSLACVSSACACRKTNAQSSIKTFSRSKASQKRRSSIVSANAPRWNEWLNSTESPQAAGAASQTRFGPRRERAEESEVLRHDAQSVWHTGQRVRQHLCQEAAGVGELFWQGL